MKKKRDNKKRKVIFIYKYLNLNLILCNSKFVHLLFLNNKPKLVKIRLFFESRSKNNLFLKRIEDGSVLNLIQLYNF